MLSNNRNAGNVQVRPRLHDRRGLRLSEGGSESLIQPCAILKKDETSFYGSPPILPARCVQICYGWVILNSRGVLQIHRQHARIHQENKSQISVIVLPEF
jgi:hypothetical protein